MNLEAVSFPAHLDRSLTSNMLYLEERIVEFVNTEIFGIPVALLMQ